MPDQAPTRRWPRISPDGFVIGLLLAVCLPDKPDTAEPQKPRRRWFQFRLRTLLVAMTVACAVSSWVGYQLNWIRERHAIMADGAPMQNSQVLGRCTEVSYDNVVGAPWSLRLLGERGCCNLVLTFKKSDPQTARIRRLFPEAQVSSVGDDFLDR
jgi:hypothetical protein